MSSVAYVGTRLKAILEEDAKRLARETGCIKRERKFNGADLVQTLVFGWQGQPEASLEQLASLAQEREAAMAVARGFHGPDIVGGEGGNSHQGITCPTIRTGDPAPYATGAGGARRLQKPCGCSCTSAEDQPCKRQGGDVRDDNETLTLHEEAPWWFVAFQESISFLEERRKSSKKRRRGKCEC